MVLVNKSIQHEEVYEKKEYHCELYVVNRDNTQPKNEVELTKYKHLISLNSYANSNSFYQISSALRDNFVLIQRYKNAPL